jgi:superoxide dismutase
MRVHHDKQHQAYVDKVNTALEGTDWADRPIEEVIADLAGCPRTSTRAGARTIWKPGETP